MSFVAPIGLAGSHTLLCIVIGSHTSLCIIIMVYGMGISLIHIKVCTSAIQIGTGFVISLYTTKIITNSFCYIVK